MKLSSFYINESDINEAYPLASDTFSNVDFKDRIVGTSTPSKDRINPTLLKDIQTAASKAGVQVSITTAVSGHKKGTRHQSGQAVDIAMINGKGWSGEKSAKKNGILDAIYKFVSALESLGYKKNVGESGNPKVVLTFGFKNHHHHVHVSNTSSSSTLSSPQNQNDEDLPTPDEDETTDNKKISPELSKALEKLKTTNKSKIDVFGGKLDPVMKGFEKAYSQFGMNPVVNEEIERIKKLIK